VNLLKFSWVYPVSVCQRISCCCWLPLFSLSGPLVFLGRSAGARWSLFLPCVSPSGLLAFGLVLLFVLVGRLARVFAVRPLWGVSWLLLLLSSWFVVLFVVCRLLPLLRLAVLSWLLSALLPLVLVFLLASRCLVALSLLLLSCPFFGSRVVFLLAPCLGMRLALPLLCRFPVVLPCGACALAWVVLALLLPWLLSLLSVLLLLPVPLLTCGVLPVLRAV
jgi:hypothetical protein